MMNRIIVLLVAFSFAMTNISTAQDVPENVNPADVNVEDVSDNQLKNAVDQAQKKGYNAQQIEQMARLRGVSEANIAKMKNRIQELQTNSDGENSEYIDVDVLRNEFDELGLDDVDQSGDPLELIKDPNPVYGMKIFRNKQLNFQPNNNIPTPIDYILGTGDQLLIDIWGGAEKTYQVAINSEGNIRIPNIGPIFLSGMTIDDASNKIISRLSKIYSGITGRNKNTYVQISLNAIRSIKAVLIGEVQNPGTYTVSSLSTIFNALYSAGGVNYHGNLREIILYRGNKKFATLDVYDFLRYGDRSNDVRLEDHDLIMVMPIDKRIEIKGEVKRPMYYDLKSNETLEELIKLAGGFTNNAYPSHVTIKRKSELGLKIITLKNKEFSNFLLTSGDVVTISSILNSFQNRVEITGAVLRPYTYELTQGMTLSALINQAEGLTGDAFMLRGQITRSDDNLKLKNVSFNPAKVLDGTDPDIVLKPEDLITIKSIKELEEFETISVLGQVQNSTSLAYNDGISIEDAIFKAGGFTKSAIREHVEVARRIHPDSTNNLTKKAEVFQVKINAELSTENGSGFILQPYDQIIVRRSPIYEAQKNIQVIGQVAEPGYYTIETEEDKVSDVIKKAGGLSPFAYPPGASLSRNSGKITLDLDKILEKPNSKYDLYLREGDIITIPRALQTVSVSGAVFRNEVETRFDKTYKFKNYIGISGGFSQNALRRKAYVLHPNGSADRTKTILFIKDYPDVKPGSQIIIPTKPERQGLSAQAWIAIATSTATLALIIQQITR